MTAPLVTGTIRFESDPPDLTDAVVRVELLDVSRADAPSSVYAATTLTDLPAVDPTEPLAFSLSGPRPDPHRRYAVRVHVDVDRTGDLTPGDYVTTESYPVVTYGHPDRVDVRVRRID
jgi:uncharacterized lipoprotein YbaY